MTIIGRGERSAEKILQFLFSDWAIIPQVSIRKIIANKKPRNYPEISEEHQKSSVDLMMFEKHQWTKGQIISVRVQNGINKKGQIRGHTGEHKSKTDRVQREFLEDFGIKVVDLNEYECKNLFKEKVNYLSALEICNALWRAKVKP